MWIRLARSIFFANYFVGVLAVALALESAVQLRMPVADPLFYLAMALATILYYTRAYQPSSFTLTSNNPRTQWYHEHKRFIFISQRAIVALLAIVSLVLFSRYAAGMARWPFYFWPLLCSAPLAGLLYYGLGPSFTKSMNLRKAGWLKPVAIGYVWAIFVSLLPAAISIAGGYSSLLHPALLFWLFFKNWMFCTVNAIMFDIKDYADDSNHQLKTLVVRLGLKRTIFFVLLPLMVAGAATIPVAGAYRHLGAWFTLSNLVPFVLMFLVALSLQQRRSILYYLVVIDGLLLVKALCGIAGTFFMELNYMP